MSTFAHFRPCIFDIYIGVETQHLSSSTVVPLVFGRNFMAITTLVLQP